MTMWKQGDDVVAVDEFFQCQCASAEHTLQFELEQWIDEEPPTLTISFYLSNWRGFFSRCWLAFKYVFKIGNCDSHFDSMLFRPEDLHRLIDLVDMTGAVETWCDTLLDASEESDEEPDEEP